MAEVTLHTQSQGFDGWQKIRIGRGLEQAAGTFDLTVTERWAGQVTRRPIHQGEAAVVAIDGETVITGYVDDALPSFDADTHTVNVVGRSKTADLIDCSAVHKTGEWQGRTLLQIARDLARPFGVEVIAEVDTGPPFKKFALQEGETCFEALERAARFRGLLLVDDAAGRLVFTRVGRKKIATPLVQGENVKAGQGVFSFRDRFSRYIVKGSNAGDDFSTPAQNAHPEAKPAEDPGVTRHRPLIVIAEEPGDAARYRTRALWEAAVRMGKSARPTVVVQGWRHRDGLWLPGYRVGARIPFFDLDEEMLIAAVTYTKGEEGTLAEIELVRPEAFDLLPLREPKDGAGLWK